MFSSFQISHWRTGSSGRSRFSLQKPPARPVTSSAGAQETGPLLTLASALHRFPAEPGRDPLGVPQTKEKPSSRFRPQSHLCIDARPSSGRSDRGLGHQAAQFIGKRTASTPPRHQLVVRCVGRALGRHAEEAARRQHQRPAIAGVSASSATVKE